MLEAWVRIRCHVAGGRARSWVAEGVEISRTATEHARVEGFKVFCGDLAEAGYPAGYFDVIIASELLEHVDEPGRVVAEMARILRPGGLLWATTPNIEGLSARVLGLNWTTVSPDHLHLFSRKGISNCARLPDSASKAGHSGRQPV